MLLHEAKIRRAAGGSKSEGCSLEGLYKWFKFGHVEGNSDMEVAE